MKRRSINKKKIIIFIASFYIIIAFIIVINQIINSENVFVEDQKEKTTLSKENKETKENIQLKFGKLEDFKETCTEYNEDSSCKKYVAIIKAKITSSYSNKSTIDQNYYNIENFITNSNVNKYDEIQYWAVADMNDGSEQKVISFTVNKELIDKINNNKIIANKMGNYVEDLWVIPSLNN